MDFCPKCGAVLIQKTKNAGCPRCRYSAKGKVKINASEMMGEKKPIAVISNKAPQTNPIVEEKCKECKNDKAYFWTLQTRSSDEAETKFYKCTKCDHTWREYR
jgi:transcription factor S